MKPDEVRWHPDEQQFLSKLEQQCNSYYAHHSKDHLYYSKLASKFNVPILVVSAINALTAVGLNSFIEQKYVSVLNAILSAGTGVLGSIQLYLKINEKMSNALRASILMKRLALKISKELSILPENRVTDGQAFLADCFAEFNTALEQGNPIEKELHNHLAFTPIPKKEKYSFMNLVSLGDTSSRGSPEQTVGTRAKKLWGLADKVQKAANSPRGLLTHFHQSDSSPGGMTPEEPDVELAAQDS
jgi:hypothetical protein